MGKLIILTEEMEHKFIELWHDGTFESPVEVLDWFKKREVISKNKIEAEIANTLSENISRGGIVNLRKELMKIFYRL